MADQPVAPRLVGYKLSRVHMPADRFIAQAGHSRNFVKTVVADRPYRLDYFCRHVMSPQPIAFCFPEDTTKNCSLCPTFSHLNL